MRLTKGQVADILNTFYKDKTALVRPKSEPFLKSAQVNLSCSGLGDNLCCTTLPVKAKEQNRLIKLFPLNNFSPLVYLEGLIENPRDRVYEVVDADGLMKNDWGNGNVIQKFERAFGLKVDPKPKGHLKIKANPVKNRIGVHVSNAKLDHSLSTDQMKMFGGFIRYKNTSIVNTDSPGKTVLDLHTVHKKIIEVIDSFIEHNPQYEFVEFNRKPTGLVNGEKKYDLGLYQLTQEIAACEYFIGLNSGLMHIAAALGIKSIIINQFEKDEVYLPYLKDWEDGSVWLYPQNVHLSTKKENPLVLALNEYNITAALNGDVYPYWSEEYLDLIYEYD